MHVQDLSHRQTWDLIPLLVNDSATPEERALAQAHLRGCADCRDEFAFQMRLQAGIAVESDAASDPHAALRQLLGRIDGEDRSGSGAAHDIQPGSRSVSHRRRARRATARTHARALLAVVIAQSVALALLGVFVLNRADVPRPALSTSADTAPYQTLSRASEPQTGATIRFVPAADLSIAAMQKLLAESGLRIVAANQDNTIYTLAWSSAPPGDPTERMHDALVRLRAQRGVLLAEPVVSPSSGTTPR